MERDGGNDDAIFGVYEEVSTPLRGHRASFACARPT